MPSLTNLIDVVRSQTLAEADDVSDANLTLFLNQGIRRLSTMFRWPWLEASYDVDVVAATASYALPSDFRRLFVVKDADARITLTRLTLEEALERWGGDPPSGSQAHWYYVWNESIYLLPVPDTTESAAYTLYYQKAPTLLSAGSDTPQFLSEFHLILAYYASARVWEHEEDFEKVDALDGRFRSEAEAMARYYLKREEEFPLVYGDGVRPNLRSANNMPFLDG